MKRNRFHLCFRASLTLYFVQLRSSTATTIYHPREWPLRCDIANAYWEGRFLLLCVKLQKKHAQHISSILTWKVPITPISIFC